MEENLKEPLLEDYNLTAETYQSHRNRIDSLEKTCPDYVPLHFVIEIAPPLLILVFLWLTSIDANTIFIAGIAIMFVVSVIPNLTKYFEDRKRQTKVSEIFDKSSEILEIIRPFEQASQKYCLSRLDYIYKNKLYKKRSQGVEFEKSLDEYSETLKDLREINSRLGFIDDNDKSRIKAHENYLISRMIGGSWKKNHEKLIKSSDGIVLPDKIQSIPKQDIKENSISHTKKKREEVNQNLAPEKKYRTARKIDNWDEINRNKKITGDAGEEIAFAIEKEYLESVGRNDLADKVKHVSKEIGDGLGYDILSFFESGNEKYVEVKSTTTNINAPFNMSANELSFLEEHYDDAFICRVVIPKAEEEATSYQMLPSWEVLEREITPTSFVVRNKN